MTTSPASALHLATAAYVDMSTMATDDALWDAKSIGAIGALVCCPLAVGAALIIVTMTIWRRRSR